MKPNQQNYTDRIFAYLFSIRKYTNLKKLIFGATFKNKKAYSFEAKFHFERLHFILRGYSNGERIIYLLLSKPVWEISRFIEEYMEIKMLSDA